MDGTLREEKPHSEKFFAKPNVAAITAMNSLFYLGHDIIIYTACGWQDYKITAKWLDDNGAKYHQLICGKYNYDVLVDDRSYQDVQKLMEKLNA